MKKEAKETKGVHHQKKKRKRRRRRRRKERPGEAALPLQDFGKEEGAKDSTKFPFPAILD